MDHFHKAWPSQHARHWGTSHPFGLSWLAWARGAQSNMKTKSWEKMKAKTSTPYGSTTH